MQPIYVSDLSSIDPFFIETPLFIYDYEKVKMPQYIEMPLFKSTIRLKSEQRRNSYLIKLSEKKRKDEEKSKHNILVTPVGIAFPEKLDHGMALTDYGMALTAVSGSLAEGYSQLSGSFTIDQKRLADSLKLPSDLEILNKIAVNQEKTLKLAAQQRDEAISESKRDHRRFIIGTLLGIVGIVVAAIAIMVAVLHL